MKYFTQELYMRMQNPRDQEACDEWDRRVNSYEAELDRLMPALPESVKQFVTKINLHDANIRSMGLADSKLTLTIALEPPSTRMVTLTYTLTEPPKILRETYDAGFCTPYAEWVYDEIGREDMSGSLTHQILLSNGWEVRLKFRALEIAWSEALLPVPVHPARQTA